MEWMLKYVLLIFLVWRLTLAGQYWKHIDELVLFVMADIHISVKLIYISAGLAEKAPGFIVKNADSPPSLKLVKMKTAVSKGNTKSFISLYLHLSSLTQSSFSKSFLDSPKEVARQGK